MRGNDGAAHQPLGWDRGTLGRSKQSTSERPTVTDASKSFTEDTYALAFDSSSF